MTTINVIRNTVEPIARQYGLRKLYLFGSYAKGTADEDSDVDLLLEKGRPLSLLGISGFRQAVSEALGLEVDVVTTAGVEATFLDAISGSEVLLYEE